MPLKNTSHAYGTVAKILHWGMALLVIGMLCMGLYMSGLPTGPDRLKLYGLHKSTGLLILGLAALRFSWKLANPQPLPEPQWSRQVIRGARVAHWLLYGFMFALPLSGWVMSSAAGYPVSFYGLFVAPDWVPVQPELRALANEAHGLLGYAMMGLIGLHALAALWHHFFKRDNTLRRMMAGGKACRNQQ